jgi:hypothetical protein
VFFYVIALIIGIYNTVRKLDVSRREPEHFPHVEREAFLRWKRTELAAYSIASLACFVFVVADLGFQFLFSRTGLNWTVVRIVGFGIFGGWVAALIWAAFRASAGRRLRTELSIDLTLAPPEPRREGRSDRSET